MDSQRKNEKNAFVANTSIRIGFHRDQDIDMIVRGYIDEDIPPE